ncbi:DUF1653 domain-containing protein [Candidatus Woesearchaeota archaeon]|nr:MAG: DUF1653 domain-containing protein [Candidatus Woesearchaeota archaeon]
MEVKLGKYMNFKGHTYEVVGVAKHSETLEELVIYRDMHGQLWARPKPMFLEIVEKDGKRIPRFEFIG